MKNELYQLAPYLAGIISAVVAYLSFRESKRKTKHDELKDVVDIIRADNNRLREENARLRAEIEKCKNKEDK